MGDTEFNSMLVDVAKQLSENDLGIMKFMCKDFVKKRDMEKVKVVLDLFSELQTREKITSSDQSFLKELLRKCEKPGAIRIVEQFETKTRVREVPMDITPALGTHQTLQAQPSHQISNNTIAEDPLVTQTVNGLRKEFNFLTKNLSREWKFYLRALGVSDVEVDTIESDYPRSLKDQIYHSLVMWVRESKECATKEQLIRALRDDTVERFDLASKLEKGNY